MTKISSLKKLIGAFIAFILIMLAFRFLYAKSFTYIFLVWNLFLAWIPFQLSMLLTDRKGTSNWVNNFLLVAWLLFFPNALYIITDLIHLEDVKTEVPVWFDAILLFTSSD